MKKKCYYAHTMTSYGSTIEGLDVVTLQGLGFEVINPNTPEHSEGCKAYAEKFGRDKVMNYFTQLITRECDLVAFRSLPNGKILSGIAAEVAHAISIGMTVIELPCSLSTRMMDYPETKQYLVELGHYKI